MFEPENELGVIVVFSQQSDHHGFQVKTIRAAFPDAIIEKDGIEYRAEFEFMASSFDQHKHDHRKCDLIICWGNDCPDSVLPILALSEPRWMDTDLTLPTDAEREAYYWRRRAQRAERSLVTMQNANGRNSQGSTSEAGALVCSVCDRVFDWPVQYKDARGAQNAHNAHQRKHRTKGEQA